MSVVYRRRTHQYALGVVAAIAAVISILSFTILYLPVRAEHTGLQAAIARFQAESVARAAELGRLRTIESQLDESRRERLRFLATRTVSREEGFAAILPDLERLAQAAGIRRNEAVFNLDPEPQFGVYQLQISIPVQGSYMAATRFIHELEESETLFILDSIGLNSVQSGEDLELSLILTTYFSYES